MARELTEQQQRFLEVLFTDEVRGDFVKAKELAGYSPNYSTRSLVKSLQEEVVEATREFLSRTGPKAAMSLADVLDNPVALGNKEKITAAKDILDRIGVTRTEKIEVGTNAVFILPPKRRNDEDDDG